MEGSGVGALNCLRTIAVAIGIVCLTAHAAVGGDAILVYFSSPHCGPCRAMKPAVETLRQRGTAVRQVNVQEEPGVARRYGIRQTPTFLVLSGGQELTRLVGMQSVEKLDEALSLSPVGPLHQTTMQNDRTRQAIQALPTRLVPLNAVETTGQLNVVNRDEVMPSHDHARAIERAQAATVRLRVHEDRGFGAGTGTIIDKHGEEALVLTCGHLFRDSQGKGRVEVDVFVGGQAKTVEGRVIDYDAGDRDIALVSIRPGIPIEPVPVIQRSRAVRTGETAFSFGCDRGADPSRRDTHIIGVNTINPHLGLSNLEIAGAPIDGRSGGGLFDEKGTLIGVCNAADYQGDTGIYTGPGNIHWQLDRIGLQKLYQDAPTSQGSPGSSLAISEVTPPRSNPRTTPPSGLGSSLVPPNPPGTDEDSEILVIIRGSAARDGQSEVISLSGRDRGLIDQIRTAARR
ncbi:MAG: trypsin-like peptidase domain-containing protein [Planctomycetota bacterium]